MSSPYKQLHPDRDIKDLKLAEVYSLPQDEASRSPLAPQRNLEPSASDSHLDIKHQVPDIDDDKKGLTRSLDRSRSLDDLHIQGATGASHLQDEERPRLSKKVVCLAIFLTLVGIVCLIIGIIGMVKGTSSAYLVVVGAVTLIPGVYYIYLIVQYLRNQPGHHFHHILNTSSFDD